MENDCWIKKEEEIDYTRKHDLTIGELKLYNIFSGFTDEQAKEIIATIEQFTRIVYNFYQRNAERPLN